MYRIAIALIILGATPAAASAAPFGELSPLTIKNPARCLRATGAPGEVVRWHTTRVRTDSAARLLVARRPAGGAFGPPVELQPLKTYRLAAPHVAVGMQDDGTVTALWNADGAEDSGPEQLFGAVAAPEAPFGPARRLSEKLSLHEFSLTVAPDGRALAIVDEGKHTPVLERPPGGTFAKVADLGYTESLLGASRRPRCGQTGPRSSRGWTCRPSRRMRSAATVQERSAGQSASARGRCTRTRRSSRTSTAAPPPGTTGAVRGPRSPATADRCSRGRRPARSAG